MCRGLIAACLSLIAVSTQAQNLPRDWKRAFWRSPLHIVASLPVAAATFVVPPVGKRYVRWRTEAEANHVLQGKDTPGKAEVDLYGQTIFVRKVLGIYHIRVQ
jgi:hypothetical protein